MAPSEHPPLVFSASLEANPFLRLDGSGGGRLILTLSDESMEELDMPALLACKDKVLLVTIHPSTPETFGGKKSASAKPSSPRSNNV